MTATPDHVQGAPLDDAGGASAPYADVAVDARTNQPGGTFTYSIPPHLNVQPGQLVRVPFGPRTLRGIVTRLTFERRVDYTKPILALVHPEPLLNDTQMELAQWVSRYYMALLFDSMAPMLPPGSRSRSGALVRLVTGASEPERLPPAARRLLAYLRKHSRPLRAASLARVLGPWVPNALRALMEAGLLEELPEAEAPVQKRRRAQAVRSAVSPEEMLAFAETLTRAPKQAALARRLAERATTPYLVSAARNEFGASVLNALLDKGYASIDEVGEEAPRGPCKQGEMPLMPTADQARALAAINAGQDDPTLTPRTFLLQGVTGSGKTEVYLQAIAHCLERGKRALVLVPELSLTPQAVARFEARFPGRIGVLHSGLSPAQHWREWWAAREGRYDVIVGSRSAVFAPLPNIGLIVLDEEHEWTFKQTDAVPRYHARDVAIRLAELTGAVVVLGSATPDVASAYAADRGVYTHLRLPNRIERSGAPAKMADVHIVDMRQELKSGNRGVFSEALREALVDTVRSGRQALLFLNRRGAANVVECRSCGYVMRCWRCGTPYTFHSSETGHGPEARNSDGRDGRGILVSHHCNRRRRMPATCPSCRGRQIRYLGLGTQRLVEEVLALIPRARVLRWDRDATPNAQAHGELLHSLTSGEADILVGTQMITKGLDVPNVALVGVVLADVGLNFPDFRAPERTFQVLTQVAGRAGRGGSAGRVIIQTYQPDNYAIRTAAAQDYDAFYRQEMAQRRSQDNPPLTRLVRLVLGHSQEEAARKEAMRFAGILRRVMREWDMRGVDIIGPAPAYPPRLRGAWRWHLLLRADDPRLLLDKVAVPPGWLVDVDPVNVM